MSMPASFADNPDLSTQVFDLLDVVFPGVRQAARKARALGAAWETASTPFVRFEDDRIMSHVGVIELSLIVLGQSVKVGSLHAVATHPERRHRGYYRDIMQEVLQYCDARYETLVLTTQHPQYFEAFGFRVVPEHVFYLPVETAGGKHSLRQLDLSTTDSITLLHRLLETREPVSNVVGVVNEKTVFCFNEGGNALYYIPDLDVLLCLEIAGAQLSLFDVVGPRMPSLSAILAYMPSPLKEVRVCFSPDRLTAAAQPTPHVFDHGHPTYFMVRGPFAAEGHAFSLPRSART